MQFIFLSHPYRTAVTQQHTRDVTACVLFVKREVHRCDFLRFLVHFDSRVVLIGSFNFNFSSHYILLGLTLCNTNDMYYAVILCHKLSFLVRLIAIKIFNRTVALLAGI